MENHQFNLEGVIPQLQRCRVSNLPYEGGSQTFFLLVSSLIHFETTLARTESLYYFSFISLHSIRRATSANAGLPY